MLVLQSSLSWYTECGQQDYLLVMILMKPVAMMNVPSHNPGTAHSAPSFQYHEVATIWHKAK